MIEEEKEENVMTRMELCSLCSRFIDKDDEDLVLENCFHGYQKQCFLDYVLR